MRLIFIILLFLNCTKVELIRVGSTVSTFGKIELVNDTTVTGTWDLKGKQLTINNFKIHGTGTISNADIDASVNQVIFDTSINLKNITTAKTPFSTVWYGASPANADNWWNIQKSINVCRDNNLWCFTPGLGIYKYSKTLEVSKIVNNAYQFCYVHFSGDAPLWYNGKGTIFQYTGTTGPALNLQLNKGSEIDHIVFNGLWRSPGGSDSVYFNLSESQYKDQSGLPDNYSGITIDNNLPINGITNSGSSGNYLHEISLQGFGMGIAMSQNGVTRNNDATTFEHIYFIDNLKYGFVNGQAQEKGNVVSYVVSWGSIYNVINIGHFAAKQSGHYSFPHGNIAGRCIEPFNISQALWFPSSFDDWYCENIRDIGTLSTQIPLSFSNCTFEMALGISKQRIALTSNSGEVNFINSIIRYYDGIGGDIWVKGSATFDKLCSFYGWKIIYK